MKRRSKTFSCFKFLQKMSSNGTFSLISVDRDSKCACLKLRPSVDGRRSNKPVRPGRVPRDGLSWNSLNFILKEMKR